MSDLFCADLREALKLEAEAKEKVPRLLEELRHYIRTPGEIGIEVRRVRYPFTGWAVEADLTFDGEVVRHYEGFDLLKLELTELELRVMLNSGILSNRGMQYEAGK